MLGGVPTRHVEALRLVEDLGVSVGPAEHEEHRLTLADALPEVNVFLGAQAADGPSDTLSSALAEAYHRLAFQTLADQVRRSVRNNWVG